MHTTRNPMDQCAICRQNGSKSGHSHTVPDSIDSISTFVIVNRFLFASRITNSDCFAVSIKYFPYARTGNQPKHVAGHAAFHSEFVAVPVHTKRLREKCRCFGITLMDA